MKTKALYFAQNDIYKIIRKLGGQWNDLKKRPILCLMEAKECKGLYWAIPVGDYDHRDNNAQQRINKFMSYPEEDLRSCYYHVGRTTKKSIFFISDVIPISDKYIDKEFKGYDGNIYIVKNKNLIDELERKLYRLLAFEDTKKNYFRQRITDIKSALIEELQKPLP